MLPNMGSRDRASPARASPAQLGVLMYLLMTIFSLLGMQTFGGETESGTSRRPGAHPG